MNIFITRREKEILTLITQEQTTKEIAQHLYLSKHTVITHRKNLMQKFNVRNTAGLVRVAFQEGICSLNMRSAYS